MSEFLIVIGAGYVFVYLIWAFVLAFGLVKAGGPTVPSEKQIKSIKIWFYSGCLLGIFGSGMSLLLLL